MLTDHLGRKHTYLRLSLTHHCNLRCTYCLPGNAQHLSLPHKSLMQPNEIESLVKIFSSLGISKVRLTGGEPLVRKDFPAIARLISSLPVEITLSTNGILVDQYIDLLKSCGIKKVNLSLDTLNKERYASLAGADAFDKVIKNIYSLLDNQFDVRINTVIMKGKNEDDIIPLAEWTRHCVMSVRFIEFMPFPGNRWRSSLVVTNEDIRQKIASAFPGIMKLDDEPHSTSLNYRIKGHAGTFGLIGTLSQPFCSDCNRLRITADGKLKNCLFSRQETDLLTPLRQGREIQSLIADSLRHKAAFTGGQPLKNFSALSAEQLKNRSMIDIGG